jgi:hypothetical protein
LKFKKPFEVVHFAGEGRVIVEPSFVEADFALDSFGAFGVIPKVWVKSLGRQVLDFSGAVVHVKDTS